MRTLILSIILISGCATVYPPAVNVRDGKGYCPICRDSHEDVQMRWSVDYKGRNYRFCDPNCREAFLSSPEKYLKDARFNPDAVGRKEDRSP